MIARSPIPPPTAGLRQSPRPRRASWFVMFLYRHWPSLFRPRTVCSWCPQVIARAGFFSRHKTSHGVCPRCSEEAMEQARIARRLGSAAAIVFLAAVFSVSCSRREELATERTFVYRPQLHASIAVPTPQRPSLEVRP